MIFRSISELVNQKRQKRAPKKRKVREIEVDQWRKPNFKKESFQIPDVPPEKTFLKFKFRHSTAVQLFLKFMPKKLIKSIWDSSELHYDGGKLLNYGVFDANMIYRFLAIKIYIQGNHACPKKTKVNGSPLEDALMDASAYFSEKFSVTAPGKHALKHLCAHFLISSDFFDAVSSQFQSVVRELGEYVSCDEKLDHFTGNSGDIRKCPNKPAKIGLWHYQMVGKICEEIPFLLDIKMAQVHKQVEESEVMANIVDRWCDIVLSVNKNSSCRTLLCFDTHYMDSASRTVVLDRNVPYIGAVASGRFGKVFDLVKGDVKKPGDFSVAYCDATNEIFTYNYDKDDAIGTKMVMGNALNHVKGKKQQKHSIPLYDEYGVCFSGCDNFNKRLSGCMWPHKKGGRDCLGDLGKEDDFAFTCILLNSLFAFNEINNTHTEFETFCLRLADELYNSTC